MSIFLNLQIFLRLDLSKLKACSVVQEKYYKWHKMNSGNNAKNGQRGP